MERNVGGADRTARLVVGGALLGAAAAAPIDGRWRALMGAGGAVALGTALSGQCMVNKALGLNSAEGGDVAQAIEEADFSRLPQIETGASAAGVVAG
jgi:hypothetical protein